MFETVALRITTVDRLNNYLRALITYDDIEDILMCIINGSQSNTLRSFN